MDYEPSPNAPRGMIQRCRLLNYLVDIVTDPEHPHVEGQQYVIYQGDDFSQKPYKGLYGDATVLEIPFEEGVPHILDLTATEDDLHCFIETRKIVIRARNPSIPQPGGPDLQDQPAPEETRFIIYCRIQQLFGVETAELSNYIHPREPGTSPDWIDIKAAICDILRGHLIDGSFREPSLLRRERVLSDLGR